MLTIGLTGGIACGKTLVSDYFDKLGTTIIDTDVIARQLVEPKQTALAEIIEHFGKDIVDDNNNLNRQNLREIVFNSSHHRKKLESILHPKIKIAVLEQLSDLEQRNQNEAGKVPYCLLVIPLLLETKTDYPIDRILVVDCPKKLQIERVMIRDKISKQQSEAIIDSQTSRSEKLKMASDIITNDESIDSCISQVKDIHHKYLDIAQVKLA